MRPLGILPSLLIILSLAGCSPPEKPDSQLGESNSDSDGGAEASRSRFLEPARLTDADRKKLEPFGKGLALAMSVENDEVAESAWNPEAMLDIAIGETKGISPDLIVGLKRGFLGSVDQKPGGVMWASFGQPWRLLRVHEVDGETRILFRIVADGGVTYLDLVPRMRDDGEPEIVDVYSFASGEKMSETLRRLFLPQLSQQSKTPLSKLFTKADPIVEHLDDFLAITQSIQGGDYRAAVDQFNALPGEIQENKALLLIYLAAASKVMSEDPSPSGEKAYHDAVMRFEKLYGDDPAFLLMGIDYHFYKEDYPAAREAIDKLDKAVGGDSYLDFLRASVFLAEEQFDEALPLARNALDADPDVEEPYWGVVNIQLARGDFESVAKGLDDLVEKFEYEFDLKEDPVYDEFRLSPVGKAWIEKHESAKSENS